MKGHRSIRFFLLHQVIYSCTLDIFIFEIFNFTIMGSFYGIIYYIIKGVLKEATTFTERVYKFSH